LSILDFWDEQANEDYLAILSKLISFYEDTIQYGLELRCRQKHLRLTEQHLNREEIIEAKLDLAALYKRRGIEYLSAINLLESLLEEAAQMSEWLLFRIQNNLGGFSTEIGEYARACDLYEAALALAVKNYETDDLNVAVSRVNLGITFAKINENDRAKKQFEEAYRVYLNAFRPEHHLTKTTKERLDDLQ